jgi:hypothetical protein
MLYVLPAVAGIEKDVPDVVDPLHAGNALADKLDAVGIAAATGVAEAACAVAPPGLGIE